MKIIKIKKQRDILSQRNKNKDHSCDFLKLEHFVKRNVSHKISTFKCQSNSVMFRDKFCSFPLK